MTEWEELDTEGHWFGVFNADDCTPNPLAIFGDIETAHDWLRLMREHPDEDRRISGNDIAIMVIRGLKGECWNSYETPPGACQATVKAKGLGVLVCGQVADRRARPRGAGASRSREPRCPAHGGES